MIFSGGVTVRTLQAIASHMGFMREFDIVKRNYPLLYPHMAESHTGYLGLKLLGLVSFINDCQSLLYLIISYIEKFEGIFDIVASFLEATCIADLCVGRAWPLPRDEIGQRYLAIYPFAFQMIEKPWFVVTFCTYHMLMAGDSPRFNIHIHLVAKTAESSGFCKFEKTSKDDKKNNDAKNNEDLYSFEVSLGTFSCLIEKIDPKGFD